MFETNYVEDLKAYVSTDVDQKVRHIRHSQEYRPGKENAPRLAANEYLAELAETLKIPTDQLGGLHKKAQHMVPREQGVEYQLDEEKRAFDGATVSYAQTYFDVPVWRRGVTVKVKQAPTRVVSVTDNSDMGLEGTLPSEEAIERFRMLIQSARAYRDPLRLNGQEPADVGPAVRKALGLPSRSKLSRKDRTTLLNGRFVAYRYVPERRFAGKPEPSREEPEMSAIEEAAPPLLPLPDVPEQIRPGQTYLVAELIFRHDLPDFGEMVWLTLVEPETGAVLYVEPMTMSVNGMVFKRDPMVRSGDLTVTSDDSNSVLDDHDYDEVLHALNPPFRDTQSLTGTFVVIQNEEDPNIAPPTRPAGTDFDFLPRTNEFAAVNAYYHQTELFRTMESLGFVIATYFDGTTFPIPVDHRGLGNVINAHWAPNGVGGTDHMCYALCDTTNTTDPLGRAVDPWVHWHEMGGHGTLGDHVGSGTFGFAHSAGDGLAAIQMDPDSALRAVPERFRYAPFRPFTVERRFDRPAPEWAWGSANDDTGYGSEQILATCHFRAYRSIGGDHPNLGRRQFASRVMTYLILRGISNLTPATNPSNWDPVAMTTVPGRGAQLWCEELQDTDLENWTSEGLSGGAYNKVIRWAFEKQGSYGGAPPAVDVYIDDGRAGEYPFQQVHWQNQSMWNRTAPDGLPGHQNAIAGATNYMYVQVKNRGTSTATNVVVKGYHCLPGAGLTWPVDFTIMSPAAGLTAPTIAPGSGDTATLGPFEWVPNENVYGHDCVLMIASAPGDPSNVDNFTGAETVAEWRLVPNDNNVGQRNVTIEPGGGGGESLVAALDGAVFVAGNSFDRPARMELRVDMPRVLAAKGWGIDLGDKGSKFRLKPGEKRHIRLMLVKGEEFTPEELRKARDRSINVELLADGIAVGGMTYEIDPDLKERGGGQPPKDDGHRRAAKDLLDRLNVAGGETVKAVRVRKVSFEVEFGDPPD